MKKTYFIRFIAVISLIIILITGISIGPYAAFQKNPLMNEIQNIYPLYKDNQYSYSPINQKYINYLNNEISLGHKAMDIETPADKNQDNY